MFGGLKRRVFHLLPRQLRLSLIATLDRLQGRVLIPRMLYNFVRDQNGDLIPGVRISNTAVLYHPENVTFGRDVFVWHYTILDGTARIEIGEGSQIGAWVGIFTHSSHLAIRLYGRHYQHVPEAQKKHTCAAPVRIGSYCFVGAHSIIMPGSTIGNGCIVSAGSHVSGNVPDYAIVLGRPAKIQGDTRRIDARHIREDPELARYYAEWTTAPVRQKAADTGPHPPGP